MKRVLALAGGVGGAKLALGLVRVLPPDRLTVVVNTADDDIFHGLHVSPDLDTVMYTLAGLADPDRGWGIEGDAFTTLEALGRYGAPTWFGLGDRDMATHIRRTELLRDGWTLSEVTWELCSRLGVRHAVVPMTDQPVRTVVLTEEGEVAFQEYFVRQRSRPFLKGVRFAGADQARPSPPFQEALEQAGAMLFCPSNPVVSIAPILAVSGVREAVAAFPGPRLAVSPIVGGLALRGPAAKMLAELGEEASCVGVARRYAGLCDLMLIDERDRHQAERVCQLGMKVVVTNTVMRTDRDKVALARLVCQLLER